MTATPRKIIQVLGDLQKELALWDMTAQETLEIANFQQRQMLEQSSQSMRVGQIVADRAKTDQHQADAVKLEAERFEATTTDALLNAEALVKQATQIVSATQQVVSYWDAELAEARAWLARAQTRLQVAKVALDAAQRQLSLAKYQLDEAVRRYNACQNDANRRHCRNEAAAVQAAEGVLHLAMVTVELAQVELNAALIEVQQATQRFNCCTQSVAITQNAVSAATQAQTWAEDSLNQTERAVESSKTVNNASATVNRLAAQQTKVANNLLAEAKQQWRLTEEAQSHLNSAEASYESARLLSQDGQGFLSDRVDQLTQYDRPEPL